MFFSAIDEEMRKLYKSDRNKHDILLWIIYNTNYTNKYKDLKKHQCYISLRTLSIETGIEYSRTQRKFNELVKEKYISYVFKSKSRYNSSIIQCHFIEKKIAYLNNKYLVVGEENKSNLSKPSTEVTENELTNNPSTIEKPLTNETREPIELNVNEKLIQDNAKLSHELTEAQKEQIINLDTEKLNNSIIQANKFAKSKYSLNYLLAIYDNSSKEPHRNTRDAYKQEPNTKPISRYHNSFNEHYKNYSEDELEARLLKAQAKKRGLA